MKNAVARVCARVKDFFSGRRLEQARRRHEAAADRLDAAVKELLKK